MLEVSFFGGRHLAWREDRLRVCKRRLGAFFEKVGALVIRWAVIERGKRDDAEGKHCSAYHIFWALEFVHTPVMAVYIDLPLGYQCMGYVGAYATSQAISRRRTFWHGPSSYTGQ